MRPRPPGPERGAHRHVPRETAQEDLNWAEERLEKALADPRAAGVEASAEVEKYTIRVEKARAKLARLHA